MIEVGFLQHGFKIKRPGCDCRAGVGTGVRDRQVKLHAIYQGAWQWRQGDRGVKGLARRRDKIAGGFAGYEAEADAIGHKIGWREKLRGDSARLITAAEGAGLEKNVAVHINGKRDQII